MKKIIITAFIALLTSLSASAQRYNLSLNTVDFVNFGTLNLSASVAVAQHWAMLADVKYNPWEFNKNSRDTQFQNKTRQAALGATLWPWHIYSGTWFSFLAQYKEYNRGGIISRKTEEGDAFGGSISAGYSWMLHKKININIGGGLWAGKKYFTVYDCPRCGRIIDSGDKFFIEPNDIKVSFEYIF